MSQEKPPNKTKTPNVARAVNSNIGTTNRVIANYTTVVLAKAKSSASSDGESKSQ